jgi:hypothetical protein
MARNHANHAKNFATKLFKRLQPHLGFVFNNKIRGARLMRVSLPFADSIVLNPGLGCFRGQCSVLKKREIALVTQCPLSTVGPEQSDREISTGVW